MMRICGRGLSIHSLKGTDKVAIDLLVWSGCFTVAIIIYFLTGSVAIGLLGLLCFAFAVKVVINNPEDY